MDFAKTYFGLVLIELIFITVIILAITGIRFFDTKGFNDLHDKYSSYVCYDTDISLVYDGE